MQEEKGKFYEVALAVIQSYARSNINRVTIDATAEEDSYQDILMLMRLLRGLLFARTVKPLRVHGAQPEEKPVKDQCITPADVFHYGLTVVIPLMNINLLNFPTLCSE